MEYRRLSVHTMCRHSP